MSILNAARLDAHHAVVAVDTIATTGVHCSKLLMLPHLNAVIAGRGRPDVFIHAAMSLYGAQCFDAAADRLEACLAEALDAAVVRDDDMARTSGVSTDELARAHFRDGELEHRWCQELLLVGPSERTGQVALEVAVRKAKDGPIQRGTLRHMTAPALDAALWVPHLTMTTDGGAMALARQQLADMDGRLGYGGRLIVARVSTQSRQVSVKELGPITAPSGAKA
jgi:hypothetical protein